MFENLSNREKKLLIGIGALLPIVIFFFGFIRLRSAINTNKSQLDSLDLRILEQQELELEGMRADRRQTYYANASPNPAINIASSNYQKGLKATMTESGLRWSGMTASNGVKLRSNGSNGKLIGQIGVIKVTATGTLSEFNDFLSKFYRMDLLHRITSMTLTPKNEGNGELVAKSMTFELLSLETGKRRDGFEEARKHLVDSSKNYDGILKRNIFGPANSKPVISDLRKSTVTGKPYSFSIYAKDANKPDLLTFELMESDGVDAVLKAPSRKTDRSVRFEMPDMPPGKYDFKVKVSDNGFPAKSSIKEFVVEVKPKPKKPEPKVVKAKKPEPEVDYIQLVKVTGIVFDSDGKWKVWLSIGPTGDRPQLAVGETFEVGKKEYEVVSIKRDEATFSGDDKTFVARPDFETRGKLQETEL